MGVGAPHPRIVEGLMEIDKQCLSTFWLFCSSNQPEIHAAILPTASKYRSQNRNGSGASHLCAWWLTLEIFLLSSHVTEFSWPGDISTKEGILPPWVTVKVLLSRKLSLPSHHWKWLTWLRRLEKNIPGGGGMIALTISHWSQHWRCCYIGRGWLKLEEILALLWQVMENHLTLRLACPLEHIRGVSPSAVHWCRFHS